MDKGVDSQFLFDFRPKSAMSAKDILNVTLDMRSEVIRRREKGPPTLTYTVLCNNIKNLYATPGKIQLLPIDSQLNRVLPPTVDKIEG